jgi:hypothetical protein
MLLPKPITNLWFKPKTIGWGWVPNNRNGWLVIFIFIIFVAINVSCYVFVAEYTDRLVAKFDDLTWMIIFYSTIQLICNFVLAIVALVAITKLTNSLK